MNSFFQNMIVIFSGNFYNKHYTAVIGYLFTTGVDGMDNSEKTRNKFVASMKKLMEAKPLDKITVKEIVENSEMTRQTFYRNFKDKYDLVNWHFEQLADKSFRQMGVSLTLREGLVKKFHFIQNERCFFTSAFQSQDYNSLLQYDYECILEFYTGIIRRKTGKPLDKKIQFLLEMYCRGSIYMTVEWARKDMDLEPEEMADLLILALPEPL